MYVAVYYQKTDFEGDMPPFALSKGYASFQEAYDAAMEECPNLYEGYYVSFEILEFGVLPW